MSLINNNFPNDPWYIYGFLCIFDSFTGGGGVVYHIYYIKHPRHPAK